MGLVVSQPLLNLRRNELTDFFCIQMKSGHNLKHFCRLLKGNILLVDVKKHLIRGNLFSISLQYVQLLKLAWIIPTATYD